VVRLHVTSDSGWAIIQGPVARVSTTGGTHGCSMRSRTSCMDRLGAPALPGE
jgi:hypothetical protein